MVYEVEITAAALVDAEEYVTYLREERGEDGYAERWWNGLVEAIESLERMPRRCAAIAEKLHFEEDLRHLLYKSHRIIFTIESGRVTVVRVYHAARRPLAEG